MKIICWNVNGIRANVKKGGFDWLINESPTVFCVQETKAEAEQLEDGVRNPSGYVSYFDHSKGRKGYSGVAIYTKVKPTEVSYGIGVEKLDQEGRFVGLFYEGQDLKDLLSIDSKKTSSLLEDVSKLAILNIYFPNGGGGPERLAFKLQYYDAFLSYIEKLKKKGYEIIFCGDVNTAHTEIDLARPKENVDNTGFLPVERAWLDQVVSKGYVDVFRHFNPTKIGAYTYWDQKTFARERNVGWRIDYFFVSPNLLNQVKSIHILERILGSDHCPIEFIIG